MMVGKLYRTCVVLGLVAAAGALLPGCGAQKSQKTMTQEGSDRWTATRLTVMLQLATQQYQVGDYDKCRETLNQAFALKYPLAPLHTLAARVELEKGSLEAANTHLKTAVQIDASDPEPYYLLGVLYQRWQNIPAAHDYYKLAWDKKSTEAIYLLAVVEMKMTMGHYDEAQALLEDRVIYFEQSAAVRAALAKLYTLKGNYEQACKYYREAAILSPDDAALRRNMAEAYFFAGHYAEALPVFEHLIADATAGNSNDPGVAKDKDAVRVNDPSLHLLLARTYVALHRLPEARNVLADMVHTDPHNNLAWQTLGQAALEMGDLPQASVSARNILKTEPDNLEALLLLAAVQQKGQQWTQAGQTLARAARVAPQDPTVLCMQGLTVQNQGRVAEAAQFYNQALAARPGDTWAEELLAATGQTPTLVVAPANTIKASSVAAQAEESDPEAFENDEPTTAPATQPVK